MAKEVMDGIQMVKEFQLLIGAERVHGPFPFRGSNAWHDEYNVIADDNGLVTCVATLEYYVHSGRLYFRDQPGWIAVRGKSDDQIRRKLREKAMEFKLRKEDRQQ